MNHDNVTALNLLTLVSWRGECGFLVWDTCVTIGLEQKFLYFTTAVAGSIGFQVGAFQLAMAA
jgi:hypothetical protein